MNVLQPLRPLPVGISSFEAIRADGMVYIDKTQMLAQLAGQRGYYFLSRPRRFGKSLLLSTLSCLWEGRRELFAGLWLGEEGRWRWEKHPVIVVDFNAVSIESPDRLEGDLKDHLRHQAKAFGLALEGQTPARMFFDLLVEAARQAGQPAVVLIDEYDKAIVNHLGQGEEGLRLARGNRNVLRELFVVLKASDVAKVVRFAFMTGVSRFSQVSVFSAANQFDDLTLDARYAALVGLTEAEIQSALGDHLRAWADTNQTTEAEALARFRAQYNGYRFTSAPVQVYNPFSVLSALRQRELRHFWFRTGTPSFLVNLLMERGVEPSGLERVTAGERLLDKFDVDDLGTEALLFQTGYLTITGLVEGGYRLGFPNQEVRLGFLEELWRAADKGLRGPHAQPVAQLGQALSEGRLDQFFELLTGVFAAIPYAQGARLNEANFHTLFYLLVNLAGTSGVAELLNNQGRIDLALERRDRVYVFEFKCGQSADVALHQIRAAGYADRWRGSGKAVVLVGVNFDPQKRNIAEWKTDPEGGDQIPIQRATAR